MDILDSQILDDIEDYPIYDVPDINVIYMRFSFLDKRYMFYLEPLGDSLYCSVPVFNLKFLVEYANLISFDLKKRISARRSDVLNVTSHLSMSEEHATFHKRVEFPSLEYVSLDNEYLMSGIPEEVLSRLETYLRSGTALLESKQVWSVKNKCVVSFEWFINGTKEGPYIKYHNTLYMAEYRFYINGVCRGLSISWNDKGMTEAIIPSEDFGIVVGALHQTRKPPISPMYNPRKL